MARLKRYELYEGDGEIIPEEYTPPEERKQEEARGTGSQKPRNRYFTRNEDDGLGGDSPLFDDFDRFSAFPEAERKISKKPPKHYNGGWAATIIACLALLLGLAILMVPQLTGVRYRFLPNIGFMNGSLIVLDQDREQVHDQCRSEIYTDRIYQGIYIDNIHVGGMTREEAVRTLDEANGQVDAKFDLVVTVGNESWHVDSERVPISRNIGETVEKNTFLGYLFGAETPTFASGFYPPFLQTLVLSEGCSALPAFALFECRSLQSLTLPSTLTSVGACAMRGCERLTALVIPDACRAIGDEACAGCIRLSSVTYPSDATCGINVFLGCPFAKSE